MKQRRNEQCNCGSGMKFKKCCMSLHINSNPLSNKDRLIKKHNLNDMKSKTIGKRVGVLCKFHDSKKGFSWGTQRIISDETQVKTDPNFSKDDFIGLIDHLVRTEDMVTSRKVSSSVLGYLPYTESWRLSEMSYGNNEKGFILNFYVHPEGISCRECYTMRFDDWEDISKEEQYKMVG